MAKITVGGMEIVVDIAELGEAIRQLEPWIGTKRSDGGASVDGHTVKAGRSDGGAAHASPSEHTAAPKDDSVVTTKPAAGSPSAREYVSNAPRLRRVGYEPLPIARVVEAFKEILNHGASGGTPSSEIARLVDVDSGKGIGARLVPTMKRLRGLGFETDGVYRTERDLKGDRVWLPGPRMAEAIAALEA